MTSNRIFIFVLSLVTLFSVSDQARSKESTKNIPPTEIISSEIHDIKSLRIFMNRIKDKEVLESITRKLRNNTIRNPLPGKGLYYADFDEFSFEVESGDEGIISSLIYKEDKEKCEYISIDKNGSLFAKCPYPNKAMQDYRLDSRCQPQVILSGGKNGYISVEHEAQGLYDCAVSPFVFSGMVTLIKIPTDKNFSFLGKDLESTAKVTPQKENSESQKVNEDPESELFKVKKDSELLKAKLELLRLQAEADKLKEKENDQKSASRSIEIKSIEVNRFKIMPGLKFGTYYALVIGLNDYVAMPKLKTAISDARSVALTLEEDYQFKVKLLENPTRADIMDALDAFAERLDQNDNLLIYYAGHGWYDRETEQGYWFPVNAEANRRSQWLSNSSLTDLLKAIAAKHIMVVADSCYSGTLTRSVNVP
jgi:hypothetical protein